MTESQDHSFAELLQQFRRAAGLTQAELAERAHLSVRAISDLERGKNRPYQRTMAMLADGLGLTARERKQFAAARHAPLTSDDPPSAPPPSTLPLPLTRLIGRDAEIAAIMRLIASDHARLVTLTGIAGIGKTRLALAVAAQISAQFADGVYFVPLATVHDPNLIARSIARTLNLQETGEQSSADQLTAFFAGKSALLVLDNFEHLLDGVVQVVDLLAACRQLVLLVTSRAALRVRGEQRFVVPPLDCTPATAPPGAQQGAAEALFIERAREVQALLPLTPVNITSITAICRRLEGIPLAIELAAMRVATFPPPDLLRHLDHRLALLVEGPRDLPQRQQTMRGAIAWSYDLLSPREQATFRRLAVFEGGWTIAAARAVCGESEDQSELPLTLTVLVDTSFVQQEPDADASEARFSMLEILCEFGRERLEQHGELDGVLRRHAEFLFALVQATDQELRGPGQARWLAMLDREQGNLRSVLRWTKVHDARLGLCIAASVWRYWYFRGLLSEGRSWLETFLQRTQGQEGLQRYQARANFGASSLAINQGSFRQAEAFAEASFLLSRAAGDTEGMCSALNAQAHLALVQDHYRQAEQYYRQALALSRSLDDTGFLGMTLSNLAMVVTQQGDYHDALHLLEESLNYARTRGYHLGVASSLVNLSDLYYQQEKYTQAMGFAEEALQYAREVANPQLIAVALDHLGKAAARQGEYDQALVALEESLQINQEVHNRAGIADVLKHLGDVFCGQRNWPQAEAYYMASCETSQQDGTPAESVDCLISWANLLLEQGRTEQAAQYVSKAALLCADLDLPPHAFLAVRLEQAKHAIHAILGDETFQVAWGRGKTLSLQEICQSGE